MPEAGTDHTSICEERAEWECLPFVTADSAWSPPRISGANAFAARLALGACYAAEFVDYLRRHPKIMLGHRLSHIVIAMSELGELGVVENAFLEALGQVVGQGRISVSSGFDAVDYRSLPDPTGTAHPLHH